MNAREAYIALNMLPGFGPVNMRKLLEMVEEPAEVFAASRRQLESIKGLRQSAREALIHWQDHVDLEGELGRVDDLGLGIVTLADPDYPPLLREIYDAPPVLYIWGALGAEDRSAIGMVGSRNVSHYGRECTHRFGYGLASAGITVVSGLARGIDTEAHKAALAARGRTIAVIGSGLGKLYPPENQELAEKIAEHGAVISELPILTRPDKGTFPMRNRIISGMSAGVLVVEAGEKSGALITARQAAEQNRNVYAVPGPIDHPSSIGANRLIQEGARLVMTPHDVLADFGSFLPGGQGGRYAGGRSPERVLGGATETGGEEMELDFAEEAHAPNQQPNAAPARRPMPNLAPKEHQVFNAIDQRSVSVDDIVQTTGLPTGEVLSQLLMLEMKGLVRQLPGKQFQKAGGARS
jgi:DNA processing protein